MVQPSQLPLLTHYVDRPSGEGVRCSTCHSPAIRTALHVLRSLRLPSIALHLVKCTLQGGLESHSPRQTFKVSVRSMASLGRGFDVDDGSVTAPRLHLKPPARLATLPSAARARPSKTQIVLPVGASVSDLSPFFIKDSHFIFLTTSRVPFKLALFNMRNMP
jgi:hypothetical protein